MIQAFINVDVHLQHLIYLMDRYNTGLKLYFVYFMFFIRAIHWKDVFAQSPVELVWWAERHHPTVGGHSREDRKPARVHKHSLQGCLLQRY